MDLHTLRQFVAVAEAGSIHAGARRALITQPAMSVAMKKLERSVGAPLFVRSSRGVALTPAGRALLASARGVLRQVAEVELGARRIAAEPAAFTIGLLEGPASAGELTGPILDTFRSSRPSLDLRVRDLDFHDQFDAVRDGLVDVALLRAPCPGDDLAFSPLFSEPTVVVASPEHRLARRSEVTVEELLAERPLEVVRAAPAWRDFWNLAEYRVDSRGAIPTQATTLMGLCLDVLRNETINPMAQSGWRHGGVVREPTIRTLELVDGPRSEIGVGHRADETRDDVLAFVSVARDVARRMISFVPGGRLVAAAGG